MNDREKLELYVNSCDRCGTNNADNLVCNKCFSRTSPDNTGKYVCIAREIVDLPDDGIVAAIIAILMREFA